MGFGVEGGVFWSICLEVTADWVEVGADVKYTIPRPISIEMIITKIIFFTFLVCY